MSFLIDYTMFTYKKPKISTLMTNYQNYESSLAGYQTSRSILKISCISDTAVFQNRNKQLDNRLKQFYYNSVNYKVFENKLRNNVQISMTKTIKYG